MFLSKNFTNNGKPTTTSMKYSFSYYLNAFEEELRLKTVSILRETGAIIQGKRFSCKSLEGRSNYSICINADKTVSCNCYDTRGRGRIGSIENESILSVLNGPKARQMRFKLASGRLAIPDCAKCMELETSSRAEAETSINNTLSSIKGIMVESMGACNLDCIGCTRPERPMVRMRMTLADLDSIGQQLRNLGVSDLYYFSLGEPFLSRNIESEISLLRKYLPESRFVTSTNGVFMAGESKLKAARMFDKVVISLFGTDNKTANKYQKGTNFTSVFSNMKELSTYRDISDRPIEIVWKYIVFNWNDSKMEINKAVEMAQSAGVDKIDFVFTSRPLWGISWRFLFSRYFTRLAPSKNGVRSVHFESNEKCGLN